MEKLGLDDLYRMVAYIYSEQNHIRPVSATLAHFVEVCGLLAIHDNPNKKEEGSDVVPALCKALGWYFPLLAKLKVKSVEELVFRKYPYVCPYCRQRTHDEDNCKSVVGTNSTVDHQAVRRKYEENQSLRPQTLDEWQRMFQVIYPRSLRDRGRSSLGLFEELGELAEAVRVFERHPKYFAGEAADIFSYLMGRANEYALHLKRNTGQSFSFEEEFLKRYPGLCPQCGYRTCACPAIPKATVGRMAKELDIGLEEDLFDPSEELLLDRGKHAASLVLGRIGGYLELATRLPLDRGDANRALIVLCLKLASAAEGTRPDLAERFHSAAIQLGSLSAEAGTESGRTVLADFDDLITAVRDTWREISENAQPGQLELRSDSLAFKIGETLARVRLLFVFASPTSEMPLRVAGELRAIREAIRRAGRDKDFEIQDLPAATPDDVRRALLSKEYEIVHFSGHADAHTVVLEGEGGESISVPLTAIAELVNRHKNVKCLILNACESLATFSTPMAPYTIGMEAAVDDDSAIEFSRGFYDAIAGGKTIDYAIGEGRNAATMKGLEPPPIKVIRPSPI